MLVSSSPLEEGIVDVESEVFVIVCVATKQERAGMCVERIGWKPNKNIFSIYVKLHQLSGKESK